MLHAAFEDVPWHDGDGLRLLTSRNRRLLMAGHGVCSLEWATFRDHFCFCFEV